MEIVDKLIVSGNNIFHINNYGETLLHFAARSKNSQVVERLLSLGLDVNQQDYSGWTPLMDAVFYNNKEDVRILLEHGADTKIKNNDQKKAIDYAETDEIRNLLAQKN